jgi:uncharacterized protein (DUF1499 family)
VTLPLLAGLWLGCGAKMPDDVGLGPLAPCPSTPNCVSSVEPPASDAYVEPLELVGPPEQAWDTLREVLADWPRLRIVAATDDAIHAEVKSLVFRFEDDLELRLRAAEGRIDVRSASRIGHSDLGANRRRVEKLRDAMMERGVVAPGDVTWEQEP